MKKIEEKLNPISKKTKLEHKGEMEEEKKNIINKKKAIITKKMMMILFIVMVPSMKLLKILKIPIIVKT